MTSPRRALIDIATTPYYHCMARCVRQAFLYGENPLTGKSYDHRKIWVVDRMKELAGIFAIEVCAYAIMANHYHMILHVNSDMGSSWNDQEILQRWTQLFTGPVLVQKFLAGSPLDDAQQQRVAKFANIYRQRLLDISWFMRCLNEHLARQANEEDQCKGRFWEGRFKSQALLDEAAVLSCMAYVDLNPVRAGVARQPETSDFIPFSLSDYFELVDWTGRAVRNDKRGAIAAHLPPILHRLGIDSHEWLRTMRPDGNRFVRGIGRRAMLLAYAKKVGKRWLHGMGASQCLFAR